MVAILTIFFANGKIAFSTVPLLPPNIQGDTETLRLFFLLFFRFLPGRQKPGRIGIAG